MEGSFQSQRGLQLSSVAWLLDHHQAKEAERRQMVEDLGLEPGDRVLDSACGPGFWSRLFAEKVSPHGLVVGLDFSPELIEYGQASLADEPLGKIVNLLMGDFNLLPFPTGAFDAVFLGNCFCYVEDVQAVLQEHRRLARPGGRVISKEFDGGSVIFHPLDPALTLRVLAAAAQGLQADPGGSRFDNFIGRRMHGEFLKGGFETVSTRSYAIQKLAPLSPPTRRYIAANADWYGRMAAPHLSPEEHRRWADAFDPGSGECVLEKEDFYFCMIETVTVGRV